MHWMQTSGALKPRVLRAIRRRNSSKMPGFSRSTSRWLSMSRTRGRPRPAATARSAKRIAPASRPPSSSPSITASISPKSSASAAAMCSPLVIISSARGTPTRRGSRWVPPPPGRMPSLTSGRPRRALRSATRKWQAIAISSPPPSAVPWIAATNGLGDFSIIRRTSFVSGGRRGLPNSRMSAPAMKVLPRQTRTAACISGSSATAGTAAARPSRTCWLSALTGGLSIQIAPATPSPGSARRSTATD